MSKGLDIEAVAAQSAFGSVDDLAAFLARNTDSSITKLSRVSGLPKQEVERLLTNKQFRERLTEFLTYSELTPEKERKILLRMLEVATDESGATSFRDFREAATWVYRQGGMLRSETQNVDVSGAVRVAFTLDSSVEGIEGVVDEYVAPDPLAGVVGVDASTPALEEPQDEVNVDWEPVGSRRGSLLEESEGSKESGS
jgi:hypothetical protein